MALIKCPECGKEISDRAQSCPNCGAPIKNMILAGYEDSESIEEDEEDQEDDTSDEKETIVSILSLVFLGMAFILSIAKNAGLAMLFSILSFIFVVIAHFQKGKCICATIVFWIITIAFILLLVIQFLLSI